MIIKEEINEYTEIDGMKELFLADVTGWLTGELTEDQLKLKIEGSTVCQTILSKLSIRGNELKKERAENMHCYHKKTTQYVTIAKNLNMLIYEIFLAKDIPAKFNKDEEKTEAEKQEIEAFSTELKEILKKFTVDSVKFINGKKKDLENTKYTTKMNNKDKIGYIKLATQILANIFVAIVYNCSSESSEINRRLSVERIKDQLIERLDGNQNLILNRVDYADVEILLNQCIKMVKAVKDANTQTRNIMSSTFNDNFSKASQSIINKMLGIDELKEAETDQKKKASIRMLVKDFKTTFNIMKELAIKYINNASFDREMKSNFEEVSVLMTECIDNDDEENYKKLLVNAEIELMKRLQRTIKEIMIESNNATTVTLAEQIEKITSQHAIENEKSKGLLRKVLPDLKNLNISSYQQERYVLPVKRIKGFQTEPYNPPYYDENVTTFMSFCMTELESYNLESGLSDYNQWIIGSYRCLKQEKHQKAWWQLFVHNENGPIDYTCIVKNRSEYIRALTLIARQIDPTGLEGLDPVNLRNKFYSTPPQQPGELGSELLARLTENLTKYNSNWHENLEDKKLLLIMFYERVTADKLLNELASVRYSQLKGSQNSGDITLLRTMLLDYELSEMEKSRILNKNNSSTRMVKRIDMKAVKLFLQGHFCNLRNKEFIIAKAMSKELPAENLDQAIQQYANEISKISNKSRQKKKKEKSNKMIFTGYDPNLTKHENYSNIADPGDDNCEEIPDDQRSLISQNNEKSDQEYDDDDVQENEDQTNSDQEQEDYEYNSSDNDEESESSYEMDSSCEDQNDYEGTNTSEE